jgi:hypothetical protein
MFVLVIATSSVAPSGHIPSPGLLSGFSMNKPEKFRAAAARARFDTSDAVSRVLQDEQRCFTSLVDNAQRLSENQEDTIRAPSAESPSDPTIADEEENMLRYLGAAVIMRWSTLPSKVQRELFDDASAMRELADAAKADLATFARH